MSTNRYDLISEISHSASNSAQLLYINTTKYGGDWLSVPHTHSCTEMFYVVGGQGNFLIGNETFSVSKGDLVVVNPLVEHTETSLHAQPLEYIVLGVDGLELSLGESEDRPFYITHFHHNSGQIQGYLQDMLHEIGEKAPGYEAICQDLLDVLIIRLMRNSNYSACMVPTADHSNKDSATVRRYINNHFKEPITLDMLANLVHISKYHMAHNFTKAYGISPINYLLNLRMQESCILLESTNFSMSHIAQTVGFSSPCYFSQIFKKAMGVSPSEYRAKQMGKGKQQ